eukprot:1500473-Pleurochrysis_carterae.AAC.1
MTLNALCFILLAVYATLLRLDHGAIAALVRSSGHAVASFAFRASHDVFSYLVLAALSALLVASLLPALKILGQLVHSSFVRAPRARTKNCWYIDSSPFASAFDATMRSALESFCEARFISLLFTLTLSGVYGYLAVCARLIGLYADTPTSSLPTRFDVSIDWLSARSRALAATCLCLHLAIGAAT